MYAYEYICWKNITFSMIKRVDHELKKKLKFDIYRRMGHILVL